MNHDHLKMLTELVNGNGNYIEFSFRGDRLLKTHQSHMYIRLNNIPFNKWVSKCFSFSPSNSCFDEASKVIINFVETLF